MKRKDEEGFDFKAETEGMMHDTDEVADVVRQEGTLDTKSALRIGKKAFILAFVIIFSLMTVSFILTRVLPGGAYLRDADGEYVLDGDGNPVFETGTGKKMPFWKFILSPFLAMDPAVPGAGTVYLIMALLLVIGGVFNVLDKSEALKYFLAKVVHKYRNKKYLLLAAVCLVFMILGSTIGMSEETIPFVPVMIMLCYSLGLDSLVALALTILAAGMGFAAGVLNPFTTIIALQFGGLTVVDGLWIRLLVFAVVYGLFMAFLLPYAKKISDNPRKSLVFGEDEAARAALLAETDRPFESNPRLDRALKWFAWNIGFMAVFVIVSMFVSALSDLIMPIIVVVYVSCGIGAGIIAKTPAKKMVSQFFTGLIAVAPAVLMIMMASSVKYIITEGGVMDSILYHTVGLMNRTPHAIQPLLLYLVVMILNFFITSGSAKAALLMPILFPISDLAGINRLVTVMAFLFGDGFSNMIFPTNGGLLIGLALSPVNYGKWFKWTIPLQLAITAFACAVLMVMHAVMS